MTRDQLIADLAAIERALDTRVTVVRVIINPDGTPTGQRIVTGSFTAPPDYRPPSMETLIATAKGRTDAR